MSSGNGKHPVGVVPPGRQIAVPEDAIRRYRAEMLQRVQEHLNELGKHETVRNEAFNILMSEAVRSHHGLPAETIAQRFSRFTTADLEAIDRVAAEVADLKLRRNFNRAKSLLAELKVDDLPDYVVWSAKQVGVELVDSQAQQSS